MRRTVALALAITLIWPRCCGGKRGTLLSMLDTDDPAALEEIIRANDAIKAHLRAAAESAESSESGSGEFSQGWLATDFLEVTDEQAKELRPIQRQAAGTSTARPTSTLPSVVTDRRGNVIGTVRKVDGGNVIRINVADGPAAQATTTVGVTVATPQRAADTPAAGTQSSPADQFRQHVNDIYFVHECIYNI